MEKEKELAMKKEIDEMVEKIPYKIQAKYLLTKYEANLASVRLTMPSAKTEQQKNMILDDIIYYEYIVERLCKEFPSLKTTEYKRQQDLIND